MLRTPKPGWVYVLKAEEYYYKIGSTNNPSERITTLQIQLPFPVKTMAVIPVEDQFETEYSLHKKFKNKRMNGEWFRLNREDLAYIKELEHKEIMRDIDVRKSLQ